MGKMKDTLIRNLNINKTECNMNYSAMYQHAIEQKTAKEISAISKTDWEKGEILVGRLLEISPVVFKNDTGEEHTANKYVLETDDGNISCILGKIADTSYTLEIGKIYAIISAGQTKVKKGVANIFIIKEIPEG